MAAKPDPKLASKKANKELILKALTDPKFRKQLASNAPAALGKKELNDVQQKEVEMILVTVTSIEAQVNRMADKLLCACGVVV